MKHIWTYNYFTKRVMKFSISLRENRHESQYRPSLLDKNEETSTIGALQTQFYNLTGFVYPANFSNKYV